MKNVVYKSDDGWFYSGGVNREFGQNRVIKTFTGEDLFCVVMPLKCEPLSHNLEMIGTIDNHLTNPDE